jgi:hypothetical protein
MEWVELIQAAQIAQAIVTVVLVPPVLITYKMLTNHVRHDLLEIKDSLAGLPCVSEKRNARMAERKSGASSCPERPIARGG